MMRGKLNKMMQKGSLMVEALALLGLITLVTPIMYKKAAERTTELQDVNLATQIRMINEALDTYVRNDYAKLKTEVGLTDKLKVNANDDTNFIVKGVKSFLPTNFRLAESKFFDTSKMQFSIESLYYFIKKTSIKNTKNSKKQRYFFHKQSFR